MGATVAKERHHLMNGPAAHWLTGDMPFAESSTRVRVLGQAFMMLGSSAYRASSDFPDANWPFTTGFTGAYQVHGQVYDVAIEVTITKREGITNDPSATADPLALGN